MSSYPLGYWLSEEYDPRIPKFLPFEKVYLIQVGYKLFKISGASLSSDGPSYFTKYFSNDSNDEKILFVDRNPRIFEKIYNHLQGYQINVADDYEFIHLWTDSYYFSLPKLQKYLNREDVFATIGNQSFKIPRSLFLKDGNYPNFFTISYDSLLADNRKLIEEKKMIRPPNLRPATVSNRSPKLFEDILELLRGNDLVIRDDHHRKLLIRECRYYRFLELEQRVIKHKIINNPFIEGKQEIIIDINDLSADGVSNESPHDEIKFPIHYKRPFIDEPERPLIVQMAIDTDNMGKKHYSEAKVIINRNLGFVMLQLSNQMCQKFLHVFKSTTEDYLNENVNDKNPYVCIYASIHGCKATINGLEMKKDWVNDIINPESSNALTPNTDGYVDDEHQSKKRKENVKGDLIEIRVTKSLWRLYTRGRKVRMHALLLNGVTDEFSFNKQSLDFL
ncbi:Piso0_005713 [Millerozyma farinosa CBS 7064]|uniref:Piso0_005713 protein n=1 Tax=Pichia sorbitophila (strain ATCC MYA-4447 / BCRC 22081 / CBS 7064 / NBRC 10061 / NRRL Y-12695) TaxID=559304 RepID=G8XZR1_PICSO|nr:Piso0_005713 [Millerozyma farinosa CBS 7064]